MGIERPKTEDEKKEYKDLKAQTCESLFVAKLSQHAQEFTKAHKPYCKKCALEEFKMEKTNLYNKMKLQYRQEFAGTEKPFMDLVETFDLAKYGKPEHFDAVGVERQNERRRSGSDTWYELVLNKSFACKPYGHGCCVSISQSEMNDEELAEETRMVNDRKAKIAASATPQDLPVAGSNLKDRIPTTTSPTQTTIDPTAQK